MSRGRLRVLHLGKFYPPCPGGIELVVAELCEATAHCWRVDAVVMNDWPVTVRETQGGVAVLRAASLGRVASVPITPTLARHVWRGHYDCVVLHEPNPLAALIAAVHTPAPRLIVWHHSDIVRPFWAPVLYGPVQRALYRRAACVVVASPPLARSSAAVRFADKVAIVPYGIATDKYMVAGPEASRRAMTIRRQYRGPLALFAGRLVYYKGVDVLIRAMRDCSGTLLVIGSGPLRPRLEALVSELGMESRVKFLGYVSDEELVDYYRASDVFVLPSTEKTEAFGIVQLEAMACGVPVVSTDLPTGVSWVNQHGVTGLVVPPGDPAAMAAAMQRLFGDPGLRSKMSESARRRAAEFSRDRMVCQFVDVIDEVVGAR